MADDCCGGAPVFPYPTELPTAVWPCDNYMGTSEPIPNVETPLMSWEGFADASTILGGAVSWSPPENPATVTLVEIRPPRERQHVAWPDACFDAPPDCHQKLDLTIARNWRYHAHMLWLSYEEPATQGNFLQSFLPCPVLAQVIPNDESDTPGTCIAVTDEWNIVYISGTTTYWQKVVQGATSGAGPFDVGDFSTLPAWFAAATVVRDRILATGQPIRDKWFFAGHSYGSAIASILAAVVKIGFPEREVRLFTEGAPCPGDNRLRAILEPLQQIHLQNVGDPVCSLPPNGHLFDILSWIMTEDMRNAWRLWFPHNRRTAVAADGSYAAVNEVAVEFTTLQTLVQIIAEEAGIPNYDAHGAGVYADRCFLITD